MPSAAVPNVHVPAWKRLGLKLKSAQSTPETTIESSNDPAYTKRKRLEETHDEILSKKVKKPSKNHPKSNAQDPITPRLARKKSVTFTPETKAEDGDSIKQLFTSWVAEQKSQDPSFDFKNSNPVFQTPEPSKVEEVVDEHLDEKTRRLERVKKPKKEKAGSKSGKPSKLTEPTVTPARPAKHFLSYLKEYCESRDTWKFNKNQQNSFIRYIFDLEAIPSDYAHYIYQYVQGLQGGVRTRLRDTALAVKIKDQEDGPAGFPPKMPEPEKRQREYDAAMKKYVETMVSSHSPVEMGYEEGFLLGFSEQTMKERVAKRMRSEQILHELARMPTVEKEVVNGDDDSLKRVRMNDGSSQKVARKRKQRTATVDEESSSSDESSDSESESDSDGSSNGSPDGSSSGGEERDDTSSSSSSSSSGSGEEGDSENESSEDSEDSDSD